jgi:catechol 2,3-dioxygenase-like lactoylglutathione lyase family enzyme
MLRAINHAGITVADLDRSIGFYRDLLGLSLLDVFERTSEDIAAVVGYPGARLRIAMLRVPGDDVRLELLQYLEPLGAPTRPETHDSGTGHVCFTVDDIHALHRRLAQAGFPARSEGPVVLTHGPHRGVVALYVRDPDGYTVELFQPTPTH